MNNAKFVLAILLGTLAVSSCGMYVGSAPKSTTVHETTTQPAPPQTVVVQPNN